MVSLTAARRLALACSLVCLAGGFACQQGRALEPMPRPEDGAVANGTYTNEYFDLSYPLPSGWKEGLTGPDPSHYGYYVLSTFVPEGEQDAMIMVAAQDALFISEALGNAAAAAREIGSAMAKLEGTTVDRPPTDVIVAGRPFSWVDFSGVGLFHSTWVTEIRCHLVSFNLSTNNAERLAELKASLSKLGDAGAGSARTPHPQCVKNRARPEDLLTRVDPPVSKPFVPIPIRMVIATDGSVKDVHVIRATPEQKSAIETALGKWKFKPGKMGDQAAGVETGLLIEFTSDLTVRYLPSDQVRPY